MGTNKNISIIGLGKLGLPLSVCYASKRFKLIAIDTDKKKIDKLNDKSFNLYEPGFSDLFIKYHKNIKFTTDIKASKDSSIFIIVVPTPSQHNGNFSNSFILEVIRKIGVILKNKNSWCLIAIVSTVTPGSMENTILPALEQATGKKVGRDIGLCYSPEFVALGSVIKNFFYPDFILIGESDKKSGDILMEIRKQVCNNNPPVHRANFINAELAKIASNTFITAKISFANMMARICERSPGADISAVSTILSDDSSIGGRRLTGSIGYGGPCYPRDNKALFAYSRKIGVSADIAKFTHQFNFKQTNFLFNLVKKYIKRGQKVGILGLSYKPDTDVIEESQGIKLVLNLLSNNRKVTVYDPAALENSKKILGDRVDYAENSLECIRKSDLVIITTAWNNFKKIPYEIWIGQETEKIVIDCWRILNLKNQKGLKYIRLGQDLS